MIPDTGPLISLAAGGALDLLLLARKNVRIVLTDIVAFEATSKADQYVDGQAIKQFLDDNRHRVEVVETTLGSLALPQMREDIASGRPARLPRDLGELSITNCVISLRERNPGEPTLVLIEDDWFASNTYAVPGNVHLLSTSAFLDGLEAAGVIPSASEVRTSIQAQRPNFRADFWLDQSAEKIDDGSEWVSQFRP